MDIKMNTLDDLYNGKININEEFPNSIEYIDLTEQTNNLIT